VANTFESLCDLTRSLLCDADDTQPTGGDVFTNEALRPYFESAWREMMAMMSADQIPAAKRVWFETLAMYTGQLLPSQAAISSFESIVRLEERPAGTSVLISNVADDGNGAIKVTATAHGLTNYQQAFVGDVEGVPEANGRWFVTVIDPDNFVLRGSAFNDESEYVSGGTVVTSSDSWTEVIRVEELPDRDPSTQLSVYAWREDAFQFVGASQDVQLRITYLFNNEPPQSGSLVYSGILNPLATRTAALAAYGHNRGQGEADRLDIEARGRDRDGRDGLYYLFLSQKVRDMQKEPLQRPVDPPEHLADIYSPSYN